MKPDRRVTKSKAAIKTAFIELISTNTIENISVSKICSSADINRSTFYSYYHDQYDLLSKMEDELIEEIIPMINDSNIETTIKMIFSLFFSQKELFRHIAAANPGSRFMEKMYARLMGKGRSAEESLQNHFLFYGFSGILKYWIRTGFAMDPDTMTRQALQIIGKFAGTETGNDSGTP